MKQIVIDILVIFMITMFRYFAIAGTSFLIFYRWLSRRFGQSKIQLRNAGFPDFIREILHSSISSLGLAVMAYLVILGPLRKYTLIYADINAYPVWWIPLSLVLALILHDTYFYWTHRAMHHERVFRLVHLVHHRSVNPSPWAAYSFHIFEAIVEGAIIIVLAFLIPLYPGTLVAFTVVSFLINVYGHLGYEIMPKGFRKSIWFEIINTSCYHNLHHKKFKGNYSLYFRFWDKLLKTENPDYIKEYDRVQQQRFGIEPPVLSEPSPR